MEITKVQILKTKAGEDYRKCTLEDGKPVNIFNFHDLFRSVDVGFDIPKERLVWQDKYNSWNLLNPDEAKEGPSIDYDAMDKAPVEDKKEERITYHADQRDAIYAKHAAAMIVASHGAYGDIARREEVEAEVKRVATKLLNMELNPHV